MAHPEEIVVVGASLGGLRTAEALRREGFAGRLTLVGEESHFPPYDRPPLSKEVLIGSWEPEQARLRMDADLDVELELGRRAVGVDLAKGELALDDGRSLAFERLVVATGAAPRVPPFVREGLGGVHVLRTLEDSLALRAALEHRPRVVVIGAGWIGAEVAAACRSRELDVTVLEALRAPMVRGLGYELGGWAAALHRANGVVLHLEAGVEELEEAAGRVSAVGLADGTTIPADVVVVAVGVTPSTGWLEGSGLDLDNGVGCDATGFARGSEQVLAVGDVARWWNPLFERDLRVEHWSNAVEQADWAARSALAGRAGAEELSSVPYFWSDQYGKKIQYVGVAGEFAGVVEGALDEGRFVAIFTTGEQLVGAMCVSSPGRMIRYRRLIAEGAGPAAVEAILPAK